MLFYPSTSVVEICSGGNFTLTCVTDTGTLVWHRVGGYIKTYYTNIVELQSTPLGDHITVYPTNVSGSYITSVANITRAPLALNGTVIQCRDNGDDRKFNSEETTIVSGRKFMILYVACI